MIGNEDMRVLRVSDCKCLHWIERSGLMTVIRIRYVNGNLQHKNEGMKRY